MIYAENILAVVTSHETHHLHREFGKNKIFVFENNNTSYMYTGSCAEKKLMKNNKKKKDTPVKVYCYYTTVGTNGKFHYFTVYYDVHA